MRYQGILDKMKSQVDGCGKVHYSLSLEKNLCLFNSLVGKRVQITSTGKLQCIFCHSSVRKLYGNGSCYPCLIRLPQNDICCIKPELCHFEKGTCRDPEWAKEHCFVAHTLYLSVTSGLKVGITKTYNEKSRWVDQGATEAIAVARVYSRKEVGLLETFLKGLYNDRTNWRKMLSDEKVNLDLYTEKHKLWEHLDKQGFSFDKVDEPLCHLSYPVSRFPDKIRSYNLLKSPQVEGVLIGIKGQYLIFTEGVLNVRKFSGMEVDIGVDN